MTLLFESGTLPPKAIRCSINVIAAELAHDECTRMDLRQEMLIHFMKLPAGKSTRYYERALRNRALTYWARRVLDAPISDAGWPILERQTVCVGGLTELDRLHQSRHAA